MLMVYPPDTHSVCRFAHTNAKADAHLYGPRNAQCWISHRLLGQPALAFAHGEYG